MYLPIFSFWCIKCEYLHSDILHHVFPKEFFQSQSLVEEAINLKKIYFIVNNMNYPVGQKSEWWLPLEYWLGRGTWKTQLSTWYMCILHVLTQLKLINKIKFSIIHYFKSLLTFFIFKKNIKLKNHFIIYLRQSHEESLYPK